MSQQNKSLIIAFFIFAVVLSIVVWYFVHPSKENAPKINTDSLELSIKNKRHNDSLYYSKNETIYIKEYEKIDQVISNSTNQHPITKMLLAKYDSIREADKQGPK